MFHTLVKCLLSVLFSFLFMANIYFLGSCPLSQCCVNKAITLVLASYHILLAAIPFILSSISASYHQSYDHVIIFIIIDWDEGFILKSFACTSPEWTYQFSQLKVLCTKSPQICRGQDQIHPNLFFQYFAVVKIGPDIKFSKVNSNSSHL